MSSYYAAEDLKSIVNECSICSTELERNVAHWVYNGRKKIVYPFCETCFKQNMGSVKPKGNLNPYTCVVCLYKTSDSGCFAKKPLAIYYFCDQCFDTAVGL